MIAHSLMVHARVLEAYSHIELMYTADHIFLVLPIKDLIKKGIDPTTPFKLVTGTKPLVAHLCVLFYPRVVQIANSNGGRKALNMRHQEQKCFHGIFVWIPQHQKEYLVYVPHKRKITYLYNLFFDKIFSIALVYTSQSYAEAMDIRPAVSYITYVTYSKQQTGDIITLSQFEERNLLSENWNDTESGNKSDNNSNLVPLISKEEMDVMYSGDESDAELMSTDMLENICDESQFHPSINRKEASYNISDRFKQRQVEWKGALLSTQNMGKGLQKVFKAVVNEILQALPIFFESGSEVSYFIPEPRNFAEVTRLSEDVRKPWLKLTIQKRVILWLHLWIFIKQKFNLIEVLTK